MIICGGCRKVLGMDDYSDHLDTCKVEDLEFKKILEKECKKPVYKSYKLNNAYIDNVVKLERLFNAS